MATWLGIGVGVVVVLLFLMRRSGGSQSQAAPARPAVKVSRPSTKGERSAALPGSQEPEIEATRHLAREVPEALAALKLIAADASDPASGEAERIAQLMGEPHPVQKQLARGLDTPEDLIDAVTSDPGLTASILKTVNSAAYALSSPINSVQHAITYLGVNAVKTLVSRAAVANRQEPGTPEQEAALAKIWLSAGVASAFAQTLGKELGVERPSVLATEALFFSLGDVALVKSVEPAAAWYAADQDLLARIDAQQQATHTNTALVAAVLARQWGLPENLATAIETGLLPLAVSPEDFTHTADERRTSVLLYLSGRVGDRMAFNGLRDVGELELANAEAPDLFHLEAHLDAAGLARVPAILQSTGFRRKFNKQVEPMLPAASDS